MVITRYSLFSSIEPKVRDFIQSLPIDSFAIIPVEINDRVIAKFVKIGYTHFRLETCTRKHWDFAIKNKRIHIYGDFHDYHRVIRYNRFNKDASSYPRLCDMESK